MSAAWQTAWRILGVRRDNMGDVLMTRVADAVRSPLPFSPHRVLRNLIQVRPPDLPADEIDSVTPLFDKAPCAGSGS